jgi:hypothetical protein
MSDEPAVRDYPQMITPFNHIEPVPRRIGLPRWRDSLRHGIDSLRLGMGEVSAVLHSTCRCRFRRPD